MGHKMSCPDFLRSYQPYPLLGQAASRMRPSCVASMDLGVAVAASGIKCCFDSRRRGCRRCKVGVAGVALQAEERFLDLQHIRKHRSVWRVAGGALIGDIGMFPGEGADELPVAADAQPSLIHGSQALGVLGAVSFVTVHAQHLTLRNRVAGCIAESRAHTFVAPHALLADIRPFQFLAGALVQLMAIRAADLASGMIAEGPVLHIGHGVGTVAFEAEHGLGRRRQLTERNVLSVVTLVVLSDVIGVDRLAARSMARLAVDEGHIGPLHFLLTVDAFGKECLVLVVEMTCFQTGLITYVISEKRTHQNPLVLSHGDDGPATFHIGAGIGQQGYRQDDPEDGCLVQGPSHQPRHGAFLLSGKPGTGDGRQVCCEGSIPHPRSIPNIQKTESQKTESNPNNATIRVLYHIQGDWYKFSQLPLLIPRHSK